MELTFLGRGAGFNPACGSTSAYFIDRGKLFLIDCGESVFRTLLEGRVLDAVSEINLFITHTHSDHVGSLGSLILYAALVKKQRPAIVGGAEQGCLEDLRSLLRIFGTSEGMYRFTSEEALDGSSSLFSRVRYVKTIHCDELDSCALLFETEAGLVFYSGDMRDPAPLIELIESGRRIDKIYVDCNNERTPNRHHLSIHLLSSLVPPALKARVHCMHINNSQCLADAAACGFKIVEVGGPTPFNPVPPGGT